MGKPAAGIKCPTFVTCSFLAGALVGGIAYAAETNTPPRAVPSIQVNTTEIYGYGYYLYNPSGWGAPGCESAAYVQIVTTEPGAKELLMVATIAHTTGKNVHIWGECLSPAYLRAKAIQIVP